MHHATAYQATRQGSSRIPGPRTVHCVRSSRAKVRFVTLAAASSQVPGNRAESLRLLLSSPGIHQGPCCHDALSAKLIEQAGFPFAFMSGFCTAAAKLGAPDTGLITYSEMVEQGQFIHEATTRIPVIGDGDTGYGNALNVKRTVRGYAAAGFAGILIEDQLAPKSCGHVKGKQVVSREEAVARIRAAVDARNEGADIVIVARTDARQAVDLEEALWRVEEFAKAGADVLFIDALESEEEMRQFTSLSGAASGVPKMASMLEGGGKTPILSRQTLQQMGFKLVAYPLSLLGVSVRAMQRALDSLANDRIPGEDALPSFTELQAVVGFPEYFAEAERYAAAPSQPPPPLEVPTTPVILPSAPESENPQPAPTSAGPTPPSGADTSGTKEAENGNGRRPAASGGEGVEADAIIEPDDEAPETLTAVIVRPGGERASGDSSSQSGGQSGREDMFAQADFLRVVITDLKTGTIKLETRLPAGWMKTLATTVPQLAGMDFEAMMTEIRGQPWNKSQPIYETTTYQDKIAVYIE